jgi:hypothetical protein
MDVSDHAADIPQRIGGFSLLWEFFGLNVLSSGLVPNGCVSLVDGVDFSPLRDLDLRVREDELADGGVQRVPVDDLAGAEHDLGAAAVQAVAGGDLRVPGLQKVRQIGGLVGLGHSFPDGENRAD